MGDDRAASDEFRGLVRAKQGVLEEAAAKALAAFREVYRQSGEDGDGHRIAAKTLAIRAGNSSLLTEPFASVSYPTMRSSRMATYVLAARLL